MSYEWGVFSTQICGFDRSELIFLVWSVVVSNQDIAYFCRSFLKSHLQSEIQFCFRERLHIIFSNRKNIPLSYDGVNKKK